MAYVLLACFPLQFLRQDISLILELSDLAKVAGH